MTNEEIISTLKIPLKGFVKQSLKMKKKNMKGRSVITKLTMPTTFVKGEQNPIKLKKSKNTGLKMLERATKNLK